ncbi:MAG TPA: DUF3224 domain-containing protein [Gemmatimonadaceae bacterium]|jgi:hypothetical protein
MTQLEGTLRVVSWEEERYDAAAGQPKFTHARVVHELTGAIEGEASICYLMVYRPDESASFVGLATVTGSIGEKSGSFVMQDIGITENGLSRGRWTILPGLGSGCFRDVRGDGHFAASSIGSAYFLDVTI